MQQEKEQRDVGYSSSSSRFLVFLESGNVDFTITDMQGRHADIAPRKNTTEAEPSQIPLARASTESRQKQAAPELVRDMQAGSFARREACVCYTQPPCCTNEISALAFSQTLQGYFPSGFFALYFAAWTPLMRLGTGSHRPDQLSC